MTDDGEVRFSELQAACGLRVGIDPVANGWIDDASTASRQEAAIVRRMAGAMPNAVPR